MIEPDCGEFDDEPLRGGDDVTERGFQCELLVGFTRLGDLLGLSDSE